LCPGYNISSNPRSTPQIISFTEGAGPQGYTELAPGRFAAFRARADAVNVLPYLVGSGHVVAQSYADETLAFTTYKQWQLICLPALVLVLGIVGELFVPTLPLNIPRRGFGVYSWLALFRAQVCGLSHGWCMRLNWLMTSRSCNLRLLVILISS